MIFENQAAQFGQFLIVFRTMDKNVRNRPSVVRNADLIPRLDPPQVSKRLVLEGVAVNSSEFRACHCFGEGSTEGNPADKRRWETRTDPIDSRNNPGSANRLSLRPL